MRRMGMQRRLALRSEKIAGMDGGEEDRSKELRLKRNEATAKRRGRSGEGLLKRRCVTGAEVRELARGRSNGNARVERNIE